MFTLLIAFVVAVLALVIAVSALRGSAPEQQAQRRLKTVQESEFATSEFEAEPNVRKENRLSRVQWLNRFLTRMNLAARLHLLLEQAGVQRTVGSLLMICLLAWTGTACLLYLRFWSVPLAAVMGAGVIPLPFLYVIHRRSRRFRAFEEQLPEAIDMLASALRAGHSLMTAIGFMGREFREPLSGEFRKCFDEQNYGVDLRTALLNLGAGWRYRTFASSSRQF